MGKFSRDKGARNERLFCQLMQAAGFEAKRVPLSGACAGFKNDVLIRTQSATLEGEIKTRASGFTLLYDALKAPKGGKAPDFLAVKRDNSDFLIVLPLSVYTDLIRRKP